jgi:phosphoglycerate dehydrogenase-like enzyme
MTMYATFINTGRGATVDETGLLAALRKRPDLTALLDVTGPEPPRPDSPLYQADNVLLSPHIAGSIGREVLRQADTMIEECRRFIHGEPLRYAVTLEMLKHMA